MKVVKIAALTFSLFACEMVLAREVYRNDFSRRSSSEAVASSRWIETHYEKGAQLFKDYEGGISIGATGASIGDSQDGWFKAFRGYDNRLVNRGRLTVSEDENPCAVLSTTLQNGRVTACHPLRNSFTDGVVRVSCDIRVPTKVLVNDGHARFRLETEEMMTEASNQDALLSHALFEAGFKFDNYNAETKICPPEQSVKVLGTCADLGGDGQGTPDARSGCWPEGGVWMRVVVEANLTSKTTYDFAAYELGSDAPTFETVPVKTAVTHTGRNFLRNYDPVTMGGISGFSMRLAYGCTTAHYGDQGYEADAAFRFDNIKVEWKAPGENEFEAVYLNDFSSCRRRTLSPCGTTQCDYAMTTGACEDVFSYPARICRPYRDSFAGSGLFFPYAANPNTSLQPLGIDGWRRQHKDGWGEGYVLTNGSMRAACLGCNGNTFAFVSQLIGPKITSGRVKLEADMYVPEGGLNNWNSGTVGLILSPEAMWRELYNGNGSNVGNYQFLRVGFQGKAKGDTSADVYPLCWPKDGELTADEKCIQAKYKLTNKFWYRLSATVDIDTQKMDFSLTPIGAAQVDLGVAVTADPVYVVTGKALRQPGYNGGALPDVGAATLFSYATANTVAKSPLFANIRVWKDADTATERLVYSNDFVQRTRYYDNVATRQLTPLAEKDRMFKGVDTWQRNNAGTGEAVITGEGNQALQLASPDTLAYMAQYIGSRYERGTGRARFDFRPPSGWMYDNNNWVRVIFGNDRFVPGSLVDGDDYFLSYLFCVNLGSSGTRKAWGTIDGTGLWIYGQGGHELKFESVELSSDKWYRCEVSFDLKAKTTTSAALYEMGSEHPSADAPNGTCLSTVGAVRFYSDGKGHSSELSSVGVAERGNVKSYARWQANAPGAAMVDNIVIEKDDTGIVISVQ